MQKRASQGLESKREMMEREWKKGGTVRVVIGMKIGETYTEVKSLQFLATALHFAASYAAVPWKLL
jgi:DUF1680 family protein